MTHRHAFHDNKCVEIAPNVCLAPTVHGGSADITNADGSIAGGPTQHLAGFIVGHDAADLPHRCDGAIYVDEHFAGERPIWKMTGSINAPRKPNSGGGARFRLSPGDGGDVTLTPSVLCTRDGFHGFIRNGKWVPA